MFGERISGTFAPLILPTDAAQQVIIQFLDISTGRISIAFVRIYSIGAA
jgi:hypothetical protein